MSKIHSDYGNGRLRFYMSTSDETCKVIAPTYFYDEFTDDTMATDQWALSEGTTSTGSATAAITAAAGGLVRITTTTEDNDDACLAGEIVWNPAKGCGCEARIRLNDVSGSAFNFGFSDAKTEAADKIACTYSGTTLTSNATDCALFFHDPDATTDYIYACTVDTGTDGTVIASTTLMDTDAEWHIYRIEMDSTGNVDFYLDGNMIGRSDQDLDGAIDLCLFLGFINRESAANTMDVDYVRAWQGR